VIFFLFLVIFVVFLAAKEALDMILAILSRFEPFLSSFTSYQFVLRRRAGFCRVFSLF
jgi:hypothetical protein